MKKMPKWLWVLLWMGVIFIFSNQANSSSITHSMLENILSGMKADWIVDMLNFLIRKFSHMLEYLILSLLILNIFKNRNRSHLYLITIFICFIYAMTDEYHQTFVTGRTGQFIDVLIDTFGAIIGSSIYYFYSKHSIHK